MGEFVMQHLHYWPLLVLAIGVIIGCIFYAKNFFTLSSPEKKQQVKRWLLYAITTAEKTFTGSKQGELKLSYVYNLFVAGFPWLARWVKFETFSKLVDEVLEESKNLIEKI